jgi:site-specific recombinase XerD
MFRHSPNKLRCCAIHVKLQKSRRMTTTPSGRVGRRGLDDRRRPARLAVADITKDSMRTAFATYARDHEAASIRRCWSTWNVLCTFLYTGELLTANPMQLVGRPKLATST